MELVYGGTFRAYFVPTFAFDIRKYWPYVDQAKYEAGGSDDIPEEERKELVNFPLGMLRKGTVREFLELALLFLGVQKIEGRRISFKSPGPMHNARWMSKVIYSIKVWLFRGQFKLTKKEEEALRELALFGVRVYMRAWFTAPNAVACAREDLHLLEKALTHHNRTIRAETWGSPLVPV